MEAQALELVFARRGTSAWPGRCLEAHVEKIPKQAIKSRGPIPDTSPGTCIQERARALRAMLHPCALHVAEDAGLDVLTSLRSHQERFHSGQLPSAPSRKRFCMRQAPKSTSRHPASSSWGYRSSHRPEGRQASCQHRPHPQRSARAQAKFEGQLPLAAAVERSQHAVVGSQVRSWSALMSRPSMPSSALMGSALLPLVQVLALPVWPRA